ncbi:hypothetical protein PVAND_012564 [Polypedilum vanderplanki]|uniref:Uncharacterized protein n=1 Tax=Polypedilum vanderplanki TaxID=319348 RepID=A0A9J6CLW6_POLVA|nr:hypothetical protein PVAND_012564 [Polypedilum vanderplanki]
MVIKILIFIIVCASSSQFVTAQTYNATVYDVQLQDIWNNLILEETKIASMMNNFIAFIQLLNSTLQPLNISQCTQFLGSFDYLVQTLTNLSTLANYGPYSAISTCSDVNQKITDIEFSIRIYREIIANIYTNITILSNRNFYTILYYSQCWYYLKYGSVNQQKAATVLSTTSGLITEYYNYINLLSRDITNETIIAANLKVYKKNYCVCNANMTTTAAANTSSLEYNLQYIEAPLISLQNAIYNASVNALALAQTAQQLLFGCISPGLTNYVSYAIDLLNGLVTIGDDYNSSYTGNITACSSLKLRVSLLNYKQKQYFNIYAASARNFSLAYAYQVGMNATILNQLSIPQYNATQALIESMITLEGYMKNYTTMVYYAYVKAISISGDIQFYGDTYCGCQSTTTTAAL